MPGRQKGPARIAEFERDARAMELRKAGATFDAIGRSLDITASAAQKAVKRAMGRIGDETREEMRQLALARIEDTHRRVLEVWSRRHPVLHNGVPVMVVGPDGALVPLEDDRIKLDALTLSVKVQESFRKMLGLDAAQKFEHTGEDGEPIAFELRVKAVTERLASLKAAAGDGRIIELPPANGGAS